MTSSPITLDFALAMVEGCGSPAGLNDAELDAENGAVETAVRAVMADVEHGRLGFWRLPDDADLSGQVKRVATALPPEVRDVVVLGIGGSSLGARAISHALARPTELVGRAPSTREAANVYFPDNSDPWFLSRLLEQLKPSQTAVVAISKSGGTVETAAQLLIVRAWLEHALGAEGARARLVLVTDPKAGPLRKIADSETILSLPVPPSVGGRFSVLSAVGLLPAELAGVSSESLLAGAKAIAPSCASPRLRENPAALLATLHVLHHRLRNRPIHVLMPYSDALRPFAAWYVQLWAESLGKKRDLEGRLVESGPTPLPAVGATDQHAQVQLFMEGPRDKLVTFLRVTEGASDLEIPRVTGDFAYLGGKTMHSLLDAERRGTAIALARDGRPSLTLTIPTLDAYHLGALFFLYEAATAIAGRLYGIDAFDQPGVEEGKRLAFGLLGRQGYEKEADIVTSTEKSLSSSHRFP